MMQTYITQLPDKYPSPIRVGYMDVSITHSIPAYAPNNVGYIEGDVIQVDPNLSPQRKAEVTIHEIVHSYITQSGAGIGIEREQMESIVICLGCGLSQLIKDNPELIVKLYNDLNFQKGLYPSLITEQGQEQGKSQENYNGTKKEEKNEPNRTEKVRI